MTIEQQDVVERLRKQLFALPVQGPVPEILSREVMFAFNTARGDLMSGDSGHVIHTPGHALDLLLAVDALAANPNPPQGREWTPLQFEHAQGRTIDEMREAFHKTDLYRRGDSLLVWINEGDICIMPGTFGAHVLRPTAALTSPAMSPTNGLREQIAAIIDPGAMDQDYNKYWPDVRDKTLAKADAILAALSVSPAISGEGGEPSGSFCGAIGYAVGWQDARQTLVSHSAEREAVDEAKAREFLAQFVQDTAPIKAANIRKSNSGTVMTGTAIRALVAFAAAIRTPPPDDITYTGREGGGV